MIDKQLGRDDLHNYQERTVDHIIEKPHCGAFLDMGLGKTVSTLTAVNFLIYEELEITTALVVAPKRVAESVWEAEAQKWSHLKHLRFSKITGTTRERKRALKRPADIYLISRNNIAWLCGLYGGSMLPFDMLILDESSSFKNHKSNRFKALRFVQPSFDRVVLLTGTPAPNSYLDLWSQIYLLDRGERLEKFITRYQARYFTKSYDGWSYELNEGCEDLINEKIKDLCISMKSEDYLDLPGTLINPIELEMGPELTQKYKDFEREKVLQLFEERDDDKDITAVNAAALSTKLLQFANGAVYDEDRNVHVIHDIKIEAAKEIVEDANGKSVLIAWTYQHDRDRLMKALKQYKPVNLKTDQDIQDWNAGKIRVLLMHPASGGHGLNLQHGGHILVWYGQTWSLELYEQLNKRLDRQGQNHRVILHKLLLKGSIDMEVVKALERKAAGQAALMEAVKARIDKYLK